MEHLSVASVGIPGFVEAAPNRISVITSSIAGRSPTGRDRLCPSTARFLLAHALGIVRVLNRYWWREASQENSKGFPCRTAPSSVCNRPKSSPPTSDRTMRCLRNRLAGRVVEDARTDFHPKGDESATFRRLMNLSWDSRSLGRTLRVFSFSTSSVGQNFTADRSRSWIVPMPCLCGLGALRGSAVAPSFSRVFIPQDLEPIKGGALGHGEWQAGRGDGPEGTQHDGGKSADAVAELVGMEFWGR